MYGMKAPAFWYNEGKFAGGFLPQLLSPLGTVWQQGARLRRAWVKSHTLPLKIICVGNLTVGGQGKTPVALALAEILQNMGYAPWFLSRGHGGRETGPLRVDLNHHTAREVGDEPLLLATKAPTIIARHRAMGAYEALNQGAEWVIMDDGLQNPSLRPNLSLIVVDGMMRYGNGHLVPAGPLREKIDEGYARAQALIQIGQNDALPPLALPPHLSLIQAELQPVPYGVDSGGAPNRQPAAQSYQGRRVLAFAGIGRPQKFFTSLSRAGADMVASYAFPDHYVFTENDLCRLSEMADRLRATLITTAKDHVRLTPAWRQKIDFFAVEIRFHDPERLRELIRTC